MEFVEQLNSLTTKIRQQSTVIQSEEATKNAFIMPFIDRVLGYNVFNPNEVVPEFTADVGLKRGEKIDYAIMRDGEVQILMECKRLNEPLSLEHASQLYRYFAVTNARIAILTNGQVYNFYTDLDAPNKMDSKPFLVLDLADIDPAAVPEIAKLTKEKFDLESVINAAEELRYVSEIKREIGALFKEPSTQWVKMLTAGVYQGQFNKRVREQFTVLVAKATRQFLNDQVNSRLKTALGADGYSPNADPGDGDASGHDDAPDESAREKDDGIVTTQDELDGFAIVKAIGCSEVKPERIVSRDAKSYFAILLDDNNRKPIARLHFNNEKHRHLGLLDTEKAETLHPITSLDEIYGYADEIRAAVRRYSGDS